MTIAKTIKMESEKSGEYEIHLIKPSPAIVTLCSFTAFPKATLYLATRAYKGFYNPDPNEMPADGYDIEDAIADIQKTKLQTPLEMIHMLWLFQDVTRAFTHQLVRYRVGTSFVQESMRFFGMRKVFKVLLTGDAALGDSREEELSNLQTYTYGIVESIGSYVDLLDKGVPDQDARGVLPTNILTNIYFDCSLRTLQNIIPQRLCCQAQPGEWQFILQEMRKQIKEQFGDSVESILRAPYEKGEDCGYRASFDRECVWQKSKEKEYDTVLCKRCRNQIA
ncbi:FAD-dependent thymidylate synthase [bacterium]|nr:FAD-dependent thymidylate synthase [bacterium]